MRGYILLPPRHPSVFARMARCQLVAIEILIIKFFFYIVKHFYHEPVARGIGRPTPVYLTLNKLSYLILSYVKFRATAPDPVSQCSTYFLG